jgi:hypothetical protein
MPERRKETTMAKKTKPLRPRGYAAWQARRLYKSTQVPNKRAEQSKRQCRKPVTQDAD